MRKFNSLKSCTNCSMRKFNSLFRRLKIPTQMSISRLTLVFLAPFSDSLPFMHLRILTVHSRSHLLFEHRVDRNENLNQTYTCMPCERKMQQTRRLNLHNPLPLWTCQTMLVFNIFLVKTATATRDSCYRLDVENNSPEQKNLNAPFFGPPRMRSSRHPPCAVQHIQYLFLQKWEKLSNHHIEKCLVTKCQLPLIKSKRTVHPTWTLCFFGLLALSPSCWCHMCILLWSNGEPINH